MTARLPRLTASTLTWVRSLGSGDVSTAWRAASWYIVISIVMTWPLVLNLTRDLPGDLGDPVFVCWAVARAADHWLALLSGDAGAVTRFWHAGIFHPEPFITVYSEHFAIHALQILPVWIVTKNIILCYNLLFFASFVVGGTGMYLLARELTGSARGAFVAGLMFMFTPYRFATLSHLQGLSSQWMPLALFGLRRYLVSGRRLALAGGAGAVLLQNLSSGYYLIYFAPFVAAYTLVEMGARGLLARWRVWRDLAVAGLATLLLTLPFSVPYVMVQRRLGYRRPIWEIEVFSADLLAWITAAPKMNLWGWLYTWPRPEGILFPGLVIVVFAMVGVVVVWRGARSQWNGSARAVAAFAIVACLAAMWMAMGPSPMLAGRPLPVPSLYRIFYEYVPGFDVSRVPARFATIVVLCLAMAAAYGVAWLDWTGRRVLLALVGIGVLLDGAALPLGRNLMFATSAEVSLPDARVHPAKDAPAIWRYLTTLPPDAVLAHLPFGYLEHELRYVYYSHVDGHRLVNGYSGGFPLSYQTRVAAVQRTLEAPEAAVARLRQDGVTHVIVHTDLWPNDTGVRTVAALERAGMRIAAQVGRAYVLAMDSGGG